MISAYELIGQMKSKINSDMKYPQAFEALRAYERNTLPIPLDKIYVCFSVKKISVGYVNIDDENIKKIDTRIGVNCFVPLSDKGFVAEGFAENVMAFLSVHFSDDMTGYEVGGAVYDSTVRAYKAESVIEFSYLDE